MSRIWALLMCWLPMLCLSPSARAQCPIAFTSSTGHFIVFLDGVFQDVEPRRPQAVFQGGDALAYLSDAGDLKLFRSGKVLTLQGGEAVEVATSKHQLAWKTGPALRIPGPDGGRTICRNVGPFTVQDSIIVFHDRMQQTLSVHWNGGVRPVADVLMADGGVNWKSGPNTLLVYDEGHRRVLLFYRGNTSVLCHGADTARSQPGGDVVAYMDEYDDTFHVFDQGQVFDMDPFAPVSFQVGSGLVAFVTNTGNFRCYQGGRVWDIADHAPEEYWARDSLVIFRDNGGLKVYQAGKVDLLERAVPLQWSAIGGAVAWLDGNGVVKYHRSGQTVVVAAEPGIGAFDMVPGALSFRSRSGATKIWWQGRLYEHY